MKPSFNYENFIKISQILYSITKIDTRLIDQNCNIRFQSLTHSIPIILDDSDQEFIQINELLTKNQPTTYYHYINKYGLEYIATGIWREQFFYGSILMGPMISSISIINLIRDIIFKNNLPISERKHLEEFYQSLPVLSEAEYKNIGELLVNMCNHDFIDSQQTSTSVVKPLLDRNHLQVSVEENKQTIESRYLQQNKLMEAIAKGDKTEVNRLIHSTTNIVAFSDRIPGSPIRSSKNIAFVLNTLFRVAAERSGVHSVYLHNISERFAILIEKATTMPNLQKLVILMANDYCELVSTFATGHYSPTVKKAVDYILLNLGYPLTLQQIAKEIHINPSHLSRKFKEETKRNITEFINQKRVDEAKLYLQRGTFSITDIAFLVGYNDLNYFSKVFKKYTSVTPSQYAKKRPNPM